MGLIILRFWDWCCKSKGFRKKSEYDLIKQFLRRLRKSSVELSPKQFGHHTRQLTVTNPSFLFSRPKKEQRTANSTYPKGGVSCSKDSFVGSENLVFQIKFCGKSPALRVAANRQTV